jgi:hypothetical protein
MLRRIHDGPVQKPNKCWRGFSCGGVDYVVKPAYPRIMVRLATHVRNAQATRLARGERSMSPGWVRCFLTTRVGWPGVHRKPPAESEQRLRSRRCTGKAPLGFNPATVSGEISASMPDQSNLVVRYMGPSGISRSMLLLQRMPSNSLPTIRHPDSPHTQRDLKKCSALAGQKGKTNRDITPTSWE